MISIIFVVIIIFVIVVVNIDIVSFFYIQKIQNIGMGENFLGRNFRDKNLSQNF